MRYFISGSLLVLLTGLFAPESPAATITWSGVGNGDWFATNNWVGGVVPTNTDDVVITNCPGTVVLTNSATVRTLVISNETLTFSNWNTTLTASNIALDSGATFTHPANTSTVSPWTPNNGVFIVCTNLTVMTNASINGDALGYLGGPAQNSGRGPGGGSYGATTTYGGGGGYGGQGGYGGDGSGGTNYDAATNATLPGSGGGGSTPGNGAGGAGGGYVKIVAAGLVTMNGTISMNGAVGQHGYCGGGSGGGIQIQCGTLTGTGTIRANGANSSTGGGGGGGRIVISATNASGFGGQISANIGSSPLSFPDIYHASPVPGTVYLSDWGLLPAMLTNSGSARFSAPTGLAASVTISNYTLLLEWGWETNRLRAGTVTVRNAGKIMQTWNTATSTNASGEWIPNAGMFIECTNLTIDAGGQINGDILGFRGGPALARGYGPGGGSYGASLTYGGGGGYGGQGGYGGDGIGGTNYDAATNATLPGSGGAGSTSGNGIGGPGGGYLKIVAAGLVTVNGTITMNGTSGQHAYCGSGSGGGIQIQCGTLTGTGTIRANGANSAAGGGGGGGRIVISATNASSFGGQMSASYGSGYFAFPDQYHRSSLPGTVYLADWGLLPAVLSNGGSARFTAGIGIASSVTISNYTLMLEWGWETNRLKAGTVTVENGGKIMQSWNTAITTNAAGDWVPDAGIFIECSNLTVASGGLITGDSMGYCGGPFEARGYGPGGGSAANGYGGGGGYGGAGGRGSDPSSSGGSTYGLSNNPSAPGSGGAGSYSFNGRGGSGGGYAKIVVTGLLTLNGAISMNGTNGQHGYAGCGSGGGINLDCERLLGFGTIRANGGTGASSGGGGGGGRIALIVRQAPYYTSRTILLTTPRPSGGSGSQPGATGTIYRDYHPRGTVWSTW